MANLANRPWFTKLKPSNLVLTIDNLLADLLIQQIFFRQMLESICHTFSPPNFPAIRYWLYNIGYYNSLWKRLSSFSLISLHMRQFWGRASANTCMVLRSVTFKKQLIWLFYSVLMLENEGKQLSLLSALWSIVIVYNDQLVESLKLDKSRVNNCDYLSENLPSSHLLVFWETPF